MADKPTPVTIQIPAKLRWTVANVLLEEAIRIEAVVTPRQRKMQSGRRSLAMASDLRDLADKVRP